MLDYEKDCKQCGKCCTPSFRVNGWAVSLKNLRCKYLNDDNTCSVYGNRRDYMWCMRPFELPVEHRQRACAFGGEVIELSDNFVLKFLDDPPEEFVGTLIAGFLKWR